MEGTLVKDAAMLEAVHFCEGCCLGAGRVPAATAVLLFPGGGWRVAVPGGGGDVPPPAPGVWEAASTVGMLEAARAREATCSAAAMRVAKLPFSQTASCCCRGVFTALARAPRPAVLHPSMTARASAMAASSVPFLILSAGKQAGAGGKMVSSNRVERTLA